MLIIHTQKNTEQNFQNTSKSLPKQQKNMGEVLIISSSNLMESFLIK